MSAAAGLFGFFLVFLLWSGACVWVYFDAKKHSSGDPLKWAGGALIGGWIVLFLYFEEGRDEYVGDSVAHWDNRRKY